LQSLLPFAKVDVDARFARVGEFAELSKAIIQSTSKIGNLGVVDLNSLYEWFYVNGPEQIVPVFNTVKTRISTICL